MKTCVHASGWKRIDRMITMAEKSAVVMVVNVNLCAMSDSDMSTVIVARNNVSRASRERLAGACWTGGHVVPHGSSWTWMRWQ